MKKALSVLLCLCFLMGIINGGLADDLGLDEYRAVAASLFGMNGGLLGTGGVAASELEIDEALDQHQGRIAQVPDSLSGVSGLSAAAAAGMMPGSGLLGGAVSASFDEEVAGAVEAHHAFLAGIPPMPAAVFGSAEEIATTDKEIAVLDSDVRLTVPSDGYLHSSAEDNAYWVLPSTGILIAFAKMEYYSLAAWETALETDGYTIKTGSIGSVELISGQKYVDGEGYQLSYVYSDGGSSYMISAVRMTYDQALAFIDVMRTLRTTAYVTPSPEPTPEIVTKNELILDSVMQLTMPLDMNRYQTLEDGEIWQSLSSGLAMGFFKSGFASRDAWKTVLEADGCATEIGYIHDIPVVQGVKSIVDKGHQLTYYFNYAGSSYCIMGTSMTDAQLKQMQEIVGTMMRRDTPQETPAPSFVLNKTYRVLNTRVTVALPKDMKLYDERNGNEYWHSSSYGLLIGFSRKGYKELDAWQNSLTASGYSTGRAQYGDISVLRGDMFVEGEGYSSTYVFNYEGFSYVLVGAKLTDVQMYLMLEIMRTVHMGEAEPVLDLPDELTQIGEQAFAACGAVVAVVPESCTAIGAKAFAGSTEMIKIVIPASVTEIASDAFEGCDYLAIYAPAGSAAIAHAKAAGIPYVEQATDD